MNSFREWLSDNLRYIFLIFGVLAVLLGLFFGVREISARMSRDPDAEVLSGTTTAAAPGAAEIQTASVMEKSAEAAESTAAAAAAAVSGAEAAGASSTIESVVAVSPSGKLAENSVPAVTDIMKTYYDAVGRQDISAVRAIVDELPENTATEIASSDLKYSDVRVYTKNGLKEGSYVVYTTYESKGDSSSTAIPGMSQSYVEPDAEGSLKIIFKALDDETREYIKTVSEEDDVKTLIKEVQNAHDAARKTASSAGSTTQSYSSDNDDSSDDSYDDSDDDDSYDDSYDDEDDEDYSSDDEDYSSDDEEEDYEEEDDTPEEWTGYVPSTVNIRSAPGWDGSVISEIPGGSSVTVYGDDIKGWYHVNYDGIDGYVGHSWIE